jgi:hypothetical protein
MTGTGAIVTLDLLRADKGLGTTEWIRRKILQEEGEKFDRMSSIICSVHQILIT